MSEEVVLDEFDIGEEIQEDVEEKVEETTLPQSEEDDEDYYGDDEYSRYDEEIDYDEFDKYYDED